MYTYITEELPKALFSSFSQLDSSRVSITGHSMGGHGALTLVRPVNHMKLAIVRTDRRTQFLKNPGKYKSVSAFAPIANPVNCDWGKKAFSGYFGEDQQAKWKEHDASELVKQWKGPLDILIDVVRSPFFIYSRMSTIELLIILSGNWRQLLQARPTLT